MIHCATTERESSMARRTRKHTGEPRVEAFAVIAEVEGPSGPETLSRSIQNPRLTQRTIGRGATEITEWFVDGLLMSSREAADVALRLHPPPGAEEPPQRGLSAEALEALLPIARALAIADARRDHARDMADRLEAPALSKAEDVTIR